MALVTAMVWVQSLAWECIHTAGATKKNKKNQKNPRDSLGSVCPLEIVFVSITSTYLL